MTHITKISQISQRGSAELNEDALSVNEAAHVYAVCDGASSLIPYKTEAGKTGAYVAANITAQAFSQPLESLAAAAVAANKAIEKAHIEAGIDVSKSLNRFGTTVIALKLINNTAELLSIGDSVALCIYEDGHIELPIAYHDQDLAIMRKWRRLADSGVANIRQLIDEDVRALRESANSAEGYGLLNGDSRAEQSLKTTTIGLSGVRSILLLSDGMYLPKADPDEAEDWEGIARLYEAGGLESVLHRVRSLEDGDPELIKYPRYKVHDDASGIALDLKK